MLSLICAIIVLGGRPQDFLNWPQLWLILFTLVAVLTATRGFKAFYGGLRAVILPKEPITEELRGQAATLFRFLSKTMALVTCIGVLISLLHLFMKLTIFVAIFSPTDTFMHGTAGDVMSIGTNMYFGLLIAFHGLFWIAAVFEPVVFILKKRRGQ